MRVQRQSDIWKAKRLSLFESSAGSSRSEATHPSRRVCVCVGGVGAGAYLWHLVCLDKVLLMALTVG